MKAAILHRHDNAAQKITLVGESLFSLDHIQFLEFGRPAL
jgi:hypothetical protein